MEGEFVLVEDKMMITMHSYTNKHGGRTLIDKKTSQQPRKNEEGLAHGQIFVSLLRRHER